MKNPIKQILNLSNRIQELYQEHINYLEDNIMESIQKEIMLDETTLVKDESYQKWLSSMIECINLENFCYQELKKDFGYSRDKFKKLWVLIKKEIYMTDKLEDIHFLLDFFESGIEPYLYRRLYNQLYKIAIETRNIDVISVFERDAYLINSTGLVTINFNNIFVLGDDAFPYQIMNQAKNRVSLNYLYVLSAAIKEGEYINTLLSLKYLLSFMNKDIEEYLLKNRFILNVTSVNHSFCTVNRIGNQKTYNQLIKDILGYDALEFLKLLYSFSNVEFENISKLEFEQMNLSIEVYGLLLRGAMLGLSVGDIGPIEQCINEFRNKEDFRIIHEYVEQTMACAKGDLLLSKTKK